MEIRCRRNEFAVRHRFPCIRSSEGRGAGEGLDIGWDIRHVPDRYDRTDDQHKGPNEISKLAFVVWYAPAVSRWVKRTAEWRQEGRVRDSFIEELTGYSRKP